MLMIEQLIVILKDLEKNSNYMILHLIKLERDMDQVIHGVNNKKNIFSLSNYSLTIQIVIINFFTACVALFFLIALNIFLITSEKNISNQKNEISEKLKKISENLRQNAIKQIPTFDDFCNRASKESNREVARLECNKNKLSNNNIDYQPVQLDLTYTQQYIYSNFLNSSLIVKVFKDDGLKFVDTNEAYSDDEDVIFLDIDSKIEEKIIQNINFYKSYKEIYFRTFNSLKTFF